ncbi:hypothetical protein M3Y99_00964300 [Aphelenchoides fujianensis]|nr:hypothetical protein M3Y99_00964300 [Aphelenchoides fujianensis]
MKGKVALITNSVSTGVATAIGRRLGLAGARLILTDPNEQKLRSTVAEFKDVGIKAFGAAVDLSKNEQRKEFFQKIKEKTEVFDVIVPCFPPNRVEGDIANTTKMQLDEAYDQVLTTPFRTIKQALPFLLNSKNPSIVFALSFASYTSFFDIGLSILATQTAALGMVKAMAKDLGKQRIRVNSVVHGMLTDDGSRAMWTQNDKEIINGLSSLIPIGRVGKGTDCAPVVEFLASDRALYITGENVPVTGGINVRL